MLVGDCGRRIQRTETRVEARGFNPETLHAWVRDFRASHASIDAFAGEAGMKRYIAELIGTFVLVFGGCGAAVLAGSHIGFAGVAFAFGFSLLVMAYAIGPISGCHINPAVTFGLLLSGKFEAKDVPGYVIAEIAD